MKDKPVPGFSHGSGIADRPSRSLPPTPVGDSAARERSPVRPVRMASVSPHKGAQAARSSAGSVGQQTGGSGGGTTTDLMRSLEKVIQQLQGMSNQFGELRLTTTSHDTDYVQHSRSSGFKQLG